jgi:hypothetical protein
MVDRSKPIRVTRSPRAQIKTVLRGIMARKRDYISEIIEKRSRLLKRTNRYDQFLKRYDGIVIALDFLVKEGKKDPYSRSELLKYIPIGSVACIEGYYRMVIRDLINHGSPYDTNARKLEDIKIDIDTVLRMGKEKVSIGEFISHLVSVNNLEDMHRGFTTLIEKDFLEELNKIEDETIGKTIGEVADRLYEDIRWMFRDRHIYCHEVATRVQPRIVEAQSYVGATLVFTYAIEKMLQELIK